MMFCTPEALIALLLLCAVLLTIATVFVCLWTLFTPERETAEAERARLRATLRDDVYDEDDQWVDGGLE
jgi:hypothetical protein